MTGYRIRCGHCPCAFAVVTADSMEDALRQFADAGWHVGSAHWENRCPACVEKARAAKRELSDNRVRMEALCH